MNRLILPKLAVLLILVTLVGRLYQLQLVPDEADRFRDSTRARTTRFLPVRPTRGEIFASDGKTLLAESVPIYTVSVRPADLPSRNEHPHQRAEVFAQLSQLLGISNTLTISPAQALDQDIVLRNDLTQGLGAAVVAAAQRHEANLPLRLPITPAQGDEAAALVARYRPTLDFENQTAAAGSTSISDTLVISPGTSLQSNQALRDDLAQLVGQAALDAAGQPQSLAWATLTAPPGRSLTALQLSEAYSNTLQLTNPIAERVDSIDIPGYQTLSIKSDIPRDVALVLRENASSLPGVVVEQDYRRRYPLSDEIKTLSPLLGYIGRVGECDLARQNTARSWVGSLLDSIGHAEECGIIKKKISPDQLGIPSYLEDDRIGKDGVEASYETELRGQLGWEGLLVDANGQPVRAPQTVQPTRDGDNLVLTIDVPFQRQVEQILRNWIDISERRRLASDGKFAYKRDYKPIRAGVAIVMEVHTGRVLAMVSWPSYDNNVWGDPKRYGELRALLDTSNPENRRLTPLLNHAIALQYPPGSTLKQFDASIALQAGTITPDTIIHDPGKLVVDNKFFPGHPNTYPNAGLRAFGDIDVEQALLHSSNVFFMSVLGGNKDQVMNLKEDEQNIPEGLGIAKFAEGLDWFGFGKPTGIRLVGEQPGLVPTPAWKQKVLLQAWTTGDLYNAAIGQGNLEVTPLQLVTGAVAVANNGYLYQPQIVKAITDSSGKLVQEIQPVLANRVPVNPDKFAVVRDGMRRSVTEGPNIAARDPCSGLQIAGKTGTAEFGPLIELPPLDGKQRAPIRQSHSWFVGFAPYDNPQIEVLALVEGSGDMSDGSATITVPAVTQIMQAYFNITPPNPLPKNCQQDLPPLPARIDPNAPPKEYVRSGPGR
ncbi:MAG TPA: penicillin-binding transpeptidase domain-containing protein [Roseiflexaceae bacterium]|nr:penicillin-binding transpeptidase domain-containing protein [Roseiflexaceae bacterium]